MVHIFQHFVGHQTHLGQEPHHWDIHIRKHMAIGAGSEHGVCS